MNKQKYLTASVLLSTMLFFPALLQAATSKDESLFYAARGGHHQSVVNLVKQGANVNYLNRSRETPMHAAASKGQVNILKFLRSKGARHNIATTNGWFPLHHAVRFGHLHAARYLLNLGSPIYSRTRDGKNVFDIARATRNRAMLQLLERYRR